MYEVSKRSIKQWAEEDRPREKLLLRGKHNLTNAELLAILIGSGNRNESAVSLSQRILKDTGNNLQELGKRTVHDLIQFKGIGEAKAISIVAAIELSRRRQLTNILEKPQIKNSIDSYHLLAHHLRDLQSEECWVLLLNRANRVIDKQQISTGGVQGTVVCPRVIFRRAVEKLASSIIICHNHPSGHLAPSQADIDLTQKLRKGGKALDIEVLDHLIISERGFFSFADEGLI